MPFLPQFYKMVDFLQEKGMIVHHVWVNPPQEHDIIEVEIELGYELDKSITDFYRECNGLQLLWSHPENANLDKKIKFVGSKHFLNGYSITDDFSFDGAILIEPIKKVFLQDWYNHIYFDFTIADKREIIFANKTYIEPDFSQRIKPFDRYTLFNEHAFFLDGSPNPPVLMGDDYQACYTDSCLMNFSDYLEFILYHYASVQARRNFFSKYNGNKHPLKTIADFWEYPQIDFAKHNTNNNQLIIPFEKKWA
jgi:hypothetical protein